jgi:hypothetical protein
MVQNFKKSGMLTPRVLEPKEDCVMNRDFFLNRCFKMAGLGLLCFTSVCAAGVVNGSFEQPTTSSFIYDPLDPTLAWTFTGRSGVAANTFFTGPAPDGTQAAFVQQFGDQSGSNLSSITQALTGLTLTPTTLSFSIASRAGYSSNPIVVTYGSQNLGTFTPASTAFSIVTINFTPTATSGSLVFKSAALTAGDLDTAIDNVTVGAANTPEPATMLLFAPALLGLFFLRRRTAAN